MKFKFYLSSLVFLLASFMMVNAQTKTVKGKITDGVDALYGVNVVLQGTTTESLVMTMVILPYHLTRIFLGL